MTEYGEAPGQRGSDPWKLPDVVARNEFAADDGTKKEFARWFSGEHGVPCVVCTREGADDTPVRRRYRIFDIYSDDPKDVIGLCERHHHENGGLAEGYFFCNCCKRVFIANYSHELFCRRREGKTFCINCDRARYLRAAENWIDLRELPELSFGHIRKTQHLFAVDQDKTGHVKASGLLLVGRTEFESTSGEQLSPTTVQRHLESARERGFSRAVLILDGIYRSNATVGVYVESGAAARGQKSHEPTVRQKVSNSPALGRKPRPHERTTRTGAVILTRNQLVLLHALYDRPNGTAPSVNDWIAAAEPYMERVHGRPYASCLRQSAPRVNPLWVTKRRRGNRFTCSLTERGRGIIEGTVPAHVFGAGPYRGLRLLPPRT